jgi:propanol-preferring alcohol dehydrogenase
MGMRVIAVDGGKEKEELCKKLGAEEYIDFMTCKDIKAEVMRITTYGGMYMDVSIHFLF